MENPESFADNALWMAHKNYESSLHALQAYDLVGGAVSPHHYVGLHLYRHHPSGSGIWSTLGNLGRKVFSIVRPHLAKAGQQLVQQGSQYALQQLGKLAEPPAEGSGVNRRRIQH